MTSFRWTRRAAAMAVAACSAAASAEDLLQVHAMARAHDATLRSAQLLRRSADPRAEQARALLRPTLTATGSSARARNDPPASAFDPAGAATHATGSSVALNLRQPLFNRGSELDIAKAEAAVRSAEAELQQAGQEFILRVVTVYFEVLSAEGVLTAARANREGLAGQLGAAKKNYEVGTGTVTDVRDAQARHDLAVSEELAARNALATSRLALARLVDRRDVAPDPLRLPAALPALAPADLAAWVDASQQHPEVVRAQVAVDSARIDVQRARASRLPTVDAVGSAGLNRNTGSGAALPGNERNVSIGVELNLRLLDGRATRSRIDEARLLESKAGEDLLAVQRGIAEATERAFYDLQSGQAQAQALEAAELSSRLSLEGTQLGYRAGVRTSLDVLNAQTLLFQTQRDLARARHDVLVRHVKLRHAAGRLAEGDLAEINRLVGR